MPGSWLAHHHRDRPSRRRHPATCLLATATAPPAYGVSRPVAELPVQIGRCRRDTLPNGLALDSRTGYLYIADSLGVVWRVPSTGGTPVEWSTGTALQPLYFIGANGVELSGGAVWVSDSDRGAVLRIPIEPGGDAGTITTSVTGVGGADDFAVLPGNLIVLALNASARWSSSPRRQAHRRPNGGGRDRQPDRRQVLGPFRSPARHVRNQRRLYDRGQPGSEPACSRVHFLSSAAVSARIATVGPGEGRTCYAGWRISTRVSVVSRSRLRKSCSTTTSRCRTGTRRSAVNRTVSSPPPDVLGAISISVDDGVPDQPILDQC